MAQAQERTSVVVLPVVVHSLDGDEYLREGLADMLASRLGRSPELAVLRIDDPELATTDLAAARSAAQTVGADYVLFGSFSHFGAGASLDLSCAPVAEAAAEPRQMFVQSGALGEIIPRLDDLAQTVASHLTMGDSATPATGSADHLPGDSGGTGMAAEALSEVEDLRARVAELERIVGVGSSDGATDLVPAPSEEPAELSAPGEDEALR
jgi:TolB-like protein